MRLRFPKGSRTPRKGINMDLPTPTTLIRLVEDVGLLPQGFTYRMPELEAMALVRRRKAEIVGRFGTAADIELTAEELQEAGVIL